MNAGMIDLQASTITSPFAIEEAGVIDVAYPFNFRDLGEKSARTVGRWTLGAYIEKHQRGTHMSRFMSGLENLRTQDVGIKDFIAWAEELRLKLQTNQLSARVAFDYFTEIAAPVTGAKALLDQKISLFTVATKNPGQQTYELSIELAAKSLCPCSKAISDRGAHNQRSIITVKLIPNDSSIDFSLNELSSIIRNCASSPVFPILKREDEKWITEHAYDNPAFVEDIARNVITKLSSIQTIASIRCTVRNIESIHSHDCYATISWNR